MLNRIKIHVVIIYAVNQSHLNYLHSSLLSSELVSSSILDFFMIYITGTILATYVYATNVYASLNHKKYWNKNLDISEFKAFLAIILELGVITYPSRKVAFEDSDHGNQFIRKLMTRKRFDAIMRCWRFEDYSAEGQRTAQERKLLRRNQPFWGASVLVGMINTTCSRMFNPGQLLDIDEQCIPWKGRHVARCYNPNKPEKFHYKVYALNDAATCYQLGFYIYEGSAEVRPNNMSATEYPIWKLFTSIEKYKNRNHILVTDNWYTSIPNLENVLNSGNQSLGTIRTNKNGLPKKTGIFAKTGRNKQARGAMKQMVKPIGNTGKNGYLVAWQDNKPVHFLSSFPSFDGECQRLTKDAAGNWFRRSIPQPSIVQVYNKGMGGTDGIDQRISYYRPKVKSTASWFPRVFVHLMSMCIVNAYILYTLTRDNRDPDREMTYLQFLRKLIDQLAAEELSKKNRVETAQSSDNKRKRIDWHQNNSRLQGIHFPIQVRESSTSSTGNPKNDRNYKRTRCKVCNKNIPTQCKQCGVHLCIVVNEISTRSCFERFHRDEFF